MSYITTTQLAERLGATLYARLTDRVNGAVVDEDVAAEIVAGASGVADSYFARRYAVPIALDACPEVAPVIVARVLDLAEHDAWRTSPFVSSPPQRVEAAHAAALRWFEEVASGRLPLPAGSPAAPRESGRASVRHTTPPQSLSADEMSTL